MISCGKTNSRTYQWDELFADRTYFTVDLALSAKACRKAGRNAKLLS